MAMMLHSTSERRRALHAAAGAADTGFNSWRMLTPETSGREIEQ